MRQGWGRIAGLLGCLLLVPAAAVAAWGQPPDAGREATFNAAVDLLQQSITPSRDGRHHDMLRALRHLQDPALSPLFEALARDDEPLIMTHGILGLAEISPAHRIDTERVLAIGRIDLQVELLSTAMANRLMTNEQARQLLADPRVDLAVKVMLAGFLIRDGQLTDTRFLREATEQSHLPRAAVAAIMLMQLQDPTAAERLERIESNVDPRGRDMLRQLALRTAYRFEFHRTAPWALGLADDPDAGRQVRIAALEVALRFGAENAASLWQQRFRQARDTPTRTRLGLVALRTAPWGPNAVYEQLARRREPLLNHIGMVGRAMAQQQRIAQAVTDLARLEHPMANTWVLQYAGELAGQNDAVAILQGMIRLAASPPDPAAAGDDPHAQAIRLDHAATASQLLMDRAPGQAIELLRSLLHEYRRQEPVVRAILAGLVRGNHARAHEVVVGLYPIGTVASDDLRLLLLARGQQPLSPREMAELAVLVRGGGSDQLTLRLQAAWVWIKRTRNVEPVMQQVLAAR